MSTQNLSGSSEGNHLCTLAGTRSIAFLISLLAAVAKVRDGVESVLTSFMLRFHDSSIRYWILEPAPIPFQEGSSICRTRSKFPFWEGRRGGFKEWEGAVQLGKAHV